MQKGIIDLLIALFRTIGRYSCYQIFVLDNMLTQTIVLHKYYAVEYSNFKIILDWKRFEKL